MGEATAGTTRVLVYSDDRSVRQQVRLTLGLRIAADLPDIDVVECATYQAVLRTLDVGGIDLIVLDGEAVPLGGMGLARQIKDEIADAPPILLIVARVADAWLATWSRADAVVAYPIDPQRLPAAAADLLRSRAATVS
ncbi:response regulator transcription factor [Propioniciclava tarda]|uniref:Response regulator transcription factor n=1 Tax=Propioniciclava tarda TaxID=433330 RepID=A0A4Q9KK58_PROTD|nr:response regulator transcription factor [Propioniciclava tarda]TBT94714.1 response regulator transcription factor [Propioniciclava tarda]SMO65277.1 Response regulator receiver domain-containing protein [Propioniciclava tarda]HOA87760.1 response regulator transcription factor [Propioniciclava tarda]HQA29817.1 response regulator transcription factor [Propioniciclava tarda]HQD59766.1 response regulator transcription factor [Propioniciclava tarda]